MIEKYEILLVIYLLLFAFYAVIYLGAKKKQTKQSKEIKSYLNGVRSLLLLLTAVATILWFFL